MGSPTTVAIGGLGAIGWRVAQALRDGIDGLALTAVSARDEARARRRLDEAGIDAAVVPLEGLAAEADIVVECCPPAVFRRIAEPAIDAGRMFMPLSVGQLLTHEDLIERARRRGARIVVPTGALAGLDAVRAAAQGEIREIRMVTRKPPRSLKGAPFLEEHGIDVEAIDTPTRLFEGPAREAAKGFPANINVGVALSLAGLGPDRTRLEIWADPTVERNTHTIHLDSDATRVTITVEGIPSPDTPGTGKLTPLSVIATLKGLTAPLKVGT